MNRKTLHLVFLWIGMWTVFTPFWVNAQDQPTAPPQFLEEYSGIKQYLFEEPKSDLYFGVGAAFSLMNSRASFSGNFFQLHWMTPFWDIEVLNVSAGFALSNGSTTTEESSSESLHLTFRISPKFRIFSKLSVGPVGGLEFLSFPGVKARQNKDNFFTPSEPFSARGVIYGVAISQTFQLDSDRKIKVNQIFYKQTYSVIEANRGWTYFFDDSEINDDESRSLVKPGWVLALEINYLF